MIWVLDYRRDVEADFRVFYHLTPAQALELPAPEYLALAYRLPAYAGSMAARAARQEERGKRSRRDIGALKVESTREAITRNADLSQVISFS